jgi:hypothetical protein
MLMMTRVSARRLVCRFMILFKQDLVGASFRIPKERDRDMPVAKIKQGLFVRVHSLFLFGAAICQLHEMAKAIGR